MNSLHLRGKLLGDPGGEESSWMETWTFLYHSRYPSPNSPCEHGQEELGMNILHQCEGPPGPSLHAQELGWLGFSRPPLAFPLLPIPAIDLPCFSLSPTPPLSPVYFSSPLLHPIHLSLFPSHLPHPERLVRRRKSKPSFSQLYLPNKAWSQVLFNKRKMN